MTTPPQPPAPAAGWYPDPSGAPGQRYWDGTRWSEYRAIPSSPQSSQIQHQPKSSSFNPKEKRNLVLGAGAAVLALLFVIGINGNHDDGSKKKNTSAPSSSTAQPTPSTTTTTTKPPPGSVVPEGVRLRTENGPNGEIVIADFDIGDALFMSFTKFGARAKTKDILEYVKNKYPEAASVEVQGRFPTKDAYGNSQVSVVVDVFYSGATLGKINFAGIDNDKVWAVSDSGTIHPELQ